MKLATGTMKDQSIKGEEGLSELKSSLLLGTWHECELFLSFVSPGNTHTAVQISDVFLCTSSMTPYSCRFSFLFFFTGPSETRLSFSLLWNQGWTLKGDLVTYWDMRLHLGLNTRNKSMSPYRRKEEGQISCRRRHGCQFSKMTWPAAWGQIARRTAGRK